MIFDNLIASIVKLNSYIHEAKDSKGIVNIIKTLLEKAFMICLDPISSKDPDIWTKMNECCKKFINESFTVEIWMDTIKESTEKLANDIWKIPKEEMEIFNDSAILPFKDLSMRTEYVLQVLFDAFTHKSDTKYAKVFKTTIYENTFENWLMLLKLIKVSAETTNKDILLKYIQSMI